MTQATRHRRILAGAVAAAMLAGGCTSYRPLALREAHTPAEVGEVHVAVVSVVPFEAIAEKLAPNFESSGTKALNQALATTQATQTIVNRATQMLLGASIPGADPPSDSASAPGNTSAPSVSAASLPAMTASAPSIGGVNQHNAMLQHHLAAALHQEVVLLNQYVRDAPRANGYDRYIIRMQVTVRPLARATPYDVEVRVPFFTNTGQPKVVPLLVADNQDATSVSSLDRNLQQLGLAISALKGAYGLTGTFNRQAEDVVTALGWHYQSVANVARSNDNTLSMRISAQPTGVQRFELMPRVHNLTALLLVPHAEAPLPPCDTRPARESSSVTVQPQYQFIHATNGTRLPVVVPRYDEKSSFEVLAWARPTLPRTAAPAPSETAAPATLEVPVLLSGSAAPYSAQLLLRGGSSLTDDTVQSGALKLNGKGDTLYAKEVKVEDGTERQGLSLLYSPLTKDQAERLTGKATLTLGTNAVVCAMPPNGKGQELQAGTAHEVSVTLMPINPPRSDATPTTKLLTSRYITVKPDGTGQVNLATTDYPKVAPADVSVSFQGATPRDPLTFQGPRKDCARIEGAVVKFTGTCNVDVGLSALPLPSRAIGDALPTLKARLQETLKVGDKPTATDLPAIELQYPAPKPRRSSKD